MTQELEKSFISWQSYRKKFSHKTYVIKAGQTKRKFIIHPLPEFFQLAPNDGTQIWHFCAASVGIVTQKTFAFAMKHLQNSF